MASVARGWTAELIDFWFGLTPQQWWNPDPALDEQIRERYLALWEEQRQRLAQDFLGDAETAFAAVILFDQLPRNMFRNHADSFSTDHLGLAIAREAVDRGYDEAIAKERRGFLYLPFEHSEKLDDQQRSVALFTKLGDETMLAFARKHYDVIARFGRFPHRNAMLGRMPRAEELAATDADPTKL
jgi:uncharacterized protein (DUF924 family)